MFDFFYLLIIIYFSRELSRNLALVIAQGGLPMIPSEWLLEDVLSIGKIVLFFLLIIFILVDLILRYAASRMRKGMKKVKACFQCTDKPFYVILLCFAFDIDVPFWCAVSFCVFSACRTMILRYWKKAAHALERELDHLESQMDVHYRVICYQFTKFTNLRSLLYHLGNGLIPGMLNKIFVQVYHYEDCLFVPVFLAESYIDRLESQEVYTCLCLRDSQLKFTGKLSRIPLADISRKVLLLHLSRNASQEAIRCPKPAKQICHVYRSGERTPWQSVAAAVDENSCSDKEERILA